MLPTTKSRNSPTAKLVARCGIRSLESSWKVLGKFWESRRRLSTPSHPTDETAGGISTGYLVQGRWLIATQSVARLKPANRLSTGWFLFINLIIRAGRLTILPLLARLSVRKPHTHLPEAPGGSLCAPRHLPSGSTGKVPHEGEECHAP